MKIFITREINEEAIEDMKKINGVEIVINPKDQSLSKNEIIEKAKGCEGMITLLNDKIDKEIIDALCPKLKIIANYAVGFDNIDFKYAKEKNVAVTNTPEVMTQAVAEHAIALILACARRIVEGDEYVRAGKYNLWEPDLLLGPEIAGKILGIVGMGRIGQALAQIAYHGFGMKILYHDINQNEDIERNLQADRVSLTSLFERSDFVSLHVPLLKETKHMISKEQLKLMKNSAILVNTARGAIIDEEALIEALQEKEIFAAGLDVFEKEGSVDERLYKLDNVVLTPHIASATHEARLQMGECVVENIKEVLAGRPPKTPVS